MTQGIDSLIKTVLVIAGVFVLFPMLIAAYYTVYALKTYKKRRSMIFCNSHAKRKLKQGELALLDGTRCQYCNHEKKNGKYKR